MKKIIASLLVLVVLAVFAFPVFASGAGQVDDVVTAEQVILLGAVATALTFVFRLLFQYFKVQIGRVWVNVILFGVSLFFAGTWANLAFPPLPVEIGGYWDWLNASALLIMPIFGVASFIYNLLYSKVLMPLTVKLIK